MTCRLGDHDGHRTQPGGLNHMRLKSHNNPPSKRQSIRLNWTLFVVLLTVVLLHDVIQTLGITAADHCVGHKNYWLGLNVMNFSIYDTLLVVYLLCTLWALIDVVMQGWLHEWRQKGTLFLSLCLLACALVGALSTVKMRDMSEFIDSQQAAARAEHMHELATTSPWSLCHL
jgi:hypothetical protein